jgi:Universal stress protein UspA and related nucleotide-binding proteins
MTQRSPTDATPDRILLATDFSARCDRALDRAAQLCGEWKAELVALNVVDPAASPDQAWVWACGASDEQLMETAQRQLSRDLSGLNVRAVVRTACSDDAAAAIRETAADTRSGLVVTGVARSGITGRFLLGSTVEHLAHGLAQPLLVVRNRARAPYQRIVVATDFSESSRHALLAAARLFPGRELIVYHAYEAPLSGLADSPLQPLDAKQRECEAFLAASGLPGDVKARPVTERGVVETALTHYVRQNDIDLVAMGTHGSSGIMSLLLGSTAAKLLDWLPCDTLLVREPRSGA